MKHAFQIGEIAKLYGVGTDTIRYYEEQNLIQPKRSESGYRIYNIRDIWRLNVIRDLRQLDFSTEQIKKYLENRTVETTIALLNEERQVIEKKIADLQKLNENVGKRIQTIQEAAEKPIGTIEQIYIKDRYCHQIEEQFDMDEEVDVLMKRLINKDPQRLYLIGSNHIGCRIPLANIEKQNDHHHYCAAFLIDNKGDTWIPAGTYLRVLYKGASNQTQEYSRQLLQYARTHGWTPAGDVLEFIWIDIHEAADVEEHMTELQILVT